MLTCRFSFENLQVNDTFLIYYTDFILFYMFRTPFAKIQKIIGDSKFPKGNFFSFVY